MNEEQTQLALPELEIECPDCKGAGYHQYPHAKGHMVSLACGTCDGACMVNTEFGDRVLDFIQKNFSRMLKRSL
jgi:hypothetical protein